MKSLILFTVLFLISFSGFSQNIVEALELKEALIGAYSFGETRSTDTIIDLRNGYYEEFSRLGEDNKTVNRQAALFLNNDGTKTLAISTTEWDFVCLEDKTNLYEISSSEDSIRPVLNEEILPDLKIRAFITDTSVFYIIAENLPKYRETFTSPNATVDDVLLELYTIRYIMPQRGTKIIATLRVCDYLPLDEVEVGQDNWFIIESSFLSMELEYDKRQKKFKQKRADKK